MPIRTAHRPHVHSHIIDFRLFWTMRSNTFSCVLHAGRHVGLTSQNFIFFCTLQNIFGGLDQPSSLQRNLSNPSMQSSKRKVCIPTIMPLLETLPRHLPRAITSVISSVGGLSTFNFLFQWSIRYHLCQQLPLPMYSYHSLIKNPPGRKLVRAFKAWYICLTLSHSILGWMTRSNPEQVSS